MDPGRIVTVSGLVSLGGSGVLRADGTPASEQGMFSGEDVQLWPPTHSHQAWCGFDPGLDGAMAFIIAPRGAARPEYTIFRVGALPEHWTVGWVKVPTFTNKTRRRLRAESAADICRILGGTGLATVLMERPALIPGRAAGGATSLYGYGFWSGCLHSSGFRVQSVTPSGWKKALALSADKSRSRKLAADIFRWLPEGASHDSCEALILALLCATGVHRADEGAYP